MFHGKEPIFFKFDIIFREKLLPPPLVGLIQDDIEVKVIVLKKINAVGMLDNIQHHGW